MKKHWWHMSNGQQLNEIPFTAFIRTEYGPVVRETEVRLELKAGRPPLFYGEPNSFKLLSFEGIKQRFEEAGHGPVSHVIWGEVSETGNGSYRATYVFREGERVPFASIIPSVFVK